MKKIRLFILIMLVVSAASLVRAETIDEIRQYFELRDTLSLVNLEMKRVLAPGSISPMFSDPAAENNLTQVLNFLKARVEQFAKGNSGLQYYYESRLRGQLVEASRLYPMVLERLRNVQQTGSADELSVEPRPFFNPIDFRTLLSPALQKSAGAGAVANTSVEAPKKGPAKGPAKAPVEAPAKAPEKAPAKVLEKPSKITPQTGVPLAELSLKAMTDVPVVEVAVTRKTQAEPADGKPVIAPEISGIGGLRVEPAPLKVVQPAKVLTPELPVTKPTVAVSAKIESKHGEEKLMRPLAVIVENHNRARPQSGLATANVLYEIPVEGGITRFMALYYGLPQVIGPVRSCREYFVDRALEVDALLVHCGASPLGYQVISRSGIKSVDEIKNSRGFYRDKSRRAPHNLYTTGKKIYDYMASRVPMRLVKRVQPLNYSTNPTISDSVGNSLSIRYHSNYNLDVDFVNGAYERSMNKVKHVDRESKKALQFGAVIVQTAVMKVVDKEGRQDISFIGSGTAVIMQKGTLAVGKWLKPDMAAMTRYYDSSSKEITFVKELPVLIQVVSPSHKVIYNGKLKAAQLLKQQEKHGVDAVGNDHENSEVQSGSKDLPENLKG